MHLAVVLIILRLPQVGAAVRLNAPPFPQMKNTISYVVPVSKEQMVFAKMASAESGGLFTPTLRAAKAAALFRW
jgi:hypothetical protein